jgi:hypothetical protein
VTEQRRYRMPATGEAWRHYKDGCDSLYTIVGMARDDEGHAVVVYTPFRWSLTQLAPIYTQRLGRFLQDVLDPTRGSIVGERDRLVPRFEFEREAGEDDRCQYIRAHSHAA